MAGSVTSWLLEFYFGDNTQLLLPTSEETDKMHVALNEAVTRLKRQNPRNFQVATVCHGHGEALTP